MELVLVDRDGDHWTHNTASGEWRLPDCQLEGCGCVQDVEYPLQYLEDAFGPLMLHTD